MDVIKKFVFEELTKKIPLQAAHKFITLLKDQLNDGYEQSETSPADHLCHSNGYLYYGVVLQS